MFVTTIDDDATVPRIRVPKSSPAADSDAIPTGSVVPVPPRANVVGAFEAFDASVTLAEYGPAAFGGR